MTLIRQFNKKKKKKGKEKNQKNQKKPRNNQFVKFKGPPIGNSKHSTHRRGRAPLATETMMSSGQAQVYQPALILGAPYSNPFAPNTIYPVLLLLCVCARVFGFRNLSWHLQKNYKRITKNTLTKKKKVDINLQ